MSVENALKFLDMTRKSPELRRKLSGFKGREALSGLVALAGERGLAFSEEEYRQAVVKSAAGELDTVSLNGVLDEIGLPGIPESGD
ncbi:MAG TPA: Nif11-like leader peptide family natural product precursor [Candidatus Hydrogenedentes bacterium]|nr:Nif11-like leader peptide family natural product precursor [Candidatus Hydrogenedentota bacterium]HOH49484.1 Nif11-like leader peptide family natural product precursor [Candidatus Hydrogenedentota bacterium]HRZ18357.1 Nif11-like leader peptide family natural product precursor [Candidatus Hydrogenedentota bacterium]HRZ82912.1 Nif11-like leader peptide family natural product precursor [Candidatus Hydrogenedentota bacterium]